MEVKTLELRDGRKLGYREYGIEDGIPVLWFPGMPCQTVFHSSEFADLITKSGIRLLSLDRPGYNLSSPQPDRQLLDWADDVSEVTQILNIERFGVFGFSCGGPHALACAYKIPEQLILAVTISGPAPYDAFGVPEQIPSDSELASSANHLIELLRDPDALIEMFTTTEPESIQALVRSNSDYLRNQWLEALSKETFRNGIQGYVQDSRILDVQPWGFALEDIRANVQIWHGDADKNVPLAHAQYLAEKIPNCKLNVMSGAGHTPHPDNFDEIMNEFRKAAQVDA